MEFKLFEEFIQDEKYAIVAITGGKKWYVTSVTKGLPHSTIGSSDWKIKAKDAYLFDRESAIEFVKNNRSSRNKLGIVNVGSGKQEFEFE